ncbi:dipeptide/oligopeptide/nickel ABC transporter permease/ATP-binding protein [Micromonospora sp. AKA38]|uniref:dipeptide/oligopeptide/nickel ABC transporter permease/ATP-binding protein n=1 Tax=Micromonospora sp. AKA38 TaxID=2733861 RepID=UPI0022CB22D9|nr:dipeptide/oligopeptide/nickel ABC transporter permease/ATP-binding protein [Micromonospora sp. AKA38]GHJ12009.1 dipeptide/oligopeptide/nickel ABC transporter ATP-binding protein [Micromonospora sp. AKA38]GHJ12746.1 dipeptide/oligopeptide/nickel ABC transporter ATP-binding protein [Micromonospora sp. AKA38]GHJ18121.1 dipeptide/oligopeptide/nickel ABC transporter ATP-binding protein [Micromonospora sp. AKA38]
MSADTTVRAGRTSRRLRAFLGNPMGVVAGAVLLAIVAASVLAPLLAPQDPNLVVLSEALRPPSGDHPLGTDGNGRDILSRLLWGGRVSLQAGAIMVTVALLCGIPAGLLAGYRAKWFDGVSSWIFNMLMSLPEILIIIVVIASLGSGLAPTMITLGVLASPDIFRLTRSAVIGVREELYFDAARVAGLSDVRIIFRHVLSVVLGPVLVRSSFIFGMAIIVQSGLEFLGFGDPQRPSWGGELSNAFQNFHRAPELVIAPGVAIGLTVMALVLFGTALADSLGISLRRKAKRAARPARTGDTPVDRIETGETPADRAAFGDAPPADTLLRVEDLAVRYVAEDGTIKEVVRGVSLHVARGEVLGLVGESGSGKSQTSFAILGLLPPDATVSARQLALDGQSLVGLRESELRKLRGTRMAYVPQEPMSNLDPSFTIGAQLTKPMRHRLGLSRKAATARALDLLDRVGIPDPPRTLAAHPHQLSGGMAQRVLIAGAVSCDPELLIADEPTTALDVTVQAEVLELLRGLQRERDMGLVLVTHNLGVVADICDRVAVMRDGLIVEQQPVAGLFANPRHEYTRMLLNATLEDAPPRRERGDLQEVGS